MRILGLDPGLRHCGWGFIEQVGNGLRPLDCGTVHPNINGSLPERLMDLHHRLHQVIKALNPDMVAIEDTFINKNAGTSLKLGQARGVIILTAGLFDLPIYEYSAKAVKQAVVGTGGAQKEQVAVMVKMLLPGITPESEDASDALAVAICHSHHAQTMNFVQANQQA